VIQDNIKIKYVMCFLTIICADGKVLTGIKNQYYFSDCVLLCVIH
jgi:hypothetical protein